MTAEVVVYVHGIWMPGEEMMFIKHHLESRHGFAGRLFRYPSVQGSLDDNAELLADFVAECAAESAADCVHLVAHSLGGVLTLRMAALNPQAPPGRIVCMGSPLCGSRAAEFLHRTDWGNLILGKTITEGVVKEAANEWATGVTKDRDVGVIAGTVPVGLGRLVASFDEPNDGTVAVSETRLPGIKEHICMQVSHSGMLVSKEAADGVARFLRHGSFGGDA